MNKIVNYCKNCDAWCCYDGVYLTKEDEIKINNLVKQNKEFFLFLPKDYIVLGEWEGYVSGNKTNVKPKEYKSKDYPKHFNKTCCVFLKDNKCMLEEFAVKNGEDRWKYKPRTCCIFPLQKKDNEYVIPSSVEDDCNIGEKYPGFVSLCTCYKLKEDNFNNEQEYLKK